MRNVHFDHIGGNWKSIAIMIFALACILVGTFEIIDFSNPKLNKYLNVIGFLIITIHYSKIFWYKNYVQWNKKGALIRINSFIGKSLSFDQIKTTELNDKKLVITKKDGKTIAFDLNEIVESDTQKLNEIIINNTVTNN
ncbi:hypothetical protein [Snuella sedimenti]|uniref:Uncharacterized protein n=1 Tax=Snuella sedimenti TaxID=2798802 RepID=A0A8J7IH59_9FLAO|nr:hypothetical protein [Snuella sedimenti]MBJ6367666.1 hypothetical protein [Snuella sedimenti]